MNIWTGEIGTLQTLAMMKQLALGAQNSQKLCNLVMSLPFYAPDIVQKVDQFLRSKFTYMSEEIETLVAPEYMLMALENNGAISGDCDDISTLQGAIYKCLGIPVRFVAIRSQRDNPNYDHVFSEVKQGDLWIPYDVTLPLGFHIQYYSRVAMEV